MSLFKSALLDIYIYLLVLRNNVDLPQVKIKLFCLILVNSNLKFYLHGCCVFNIDKSFSEIVDSESSGCCMILLKCISFRDIFLFWIPGTVGIQIDIFFVILNRCSRNRVFYWKSFWFIWMAFISRFVNAKKLENLYPLLCGFKFNFDPRHLRVVHCFYNKNVC